jgi:hypothetical protein
LITSGGNLVWLPPLLRENESLNLLAEIQNQGQFRSNSGNHTCSRRVGFTVGVLVTIEIVVTVGEGVIVAVWVGSAIVVTVGVFVIVGVRLGSAIVVVVLVGDRYGVPVGVLLGVGVTVGVFVIVGVVVSVGVAVLVGVGVSVAVGVAVALGWSAQYSVITSNLAVGLSVSKVRVWVPSVNW